MTTSSDKAYWSKMSDTYDSRLKKSAKMYGQMIGLIKNELRDDAAVLDIGTGTGDIPIAIAGHVSTVEAIDFSEEMIEAAKKKAANRGIGNVVFRVQECRQLNYDDGTFDAVIVANTLHVVPHPEKVLEEARRVLRDKGHIVGSNLCPQ
jgi:phosphatidylethanolamine/phosphatidyl-N-methylethanolamine N-methyltransferase